MYVCIASHLKKYLCNDWTFQHIAIRKCKSYYYICLGSLVNIIHMQIEKKCTQNEHLYLIGSRYMNDLYKWVHQIKHKELLVNDFLKSLITSVALFAVGIKLASELGACKIF